MAQESLVGRASIAVLRLIAQSAVRGESWVTDFVNQAAHALSEVGTLPLVLEAALHGGAEPLAPPVVEFLSTVAAAHPPLPPDPPTLTVRLEEADPDAVLALAATPLRIAALRWRHHAASPRKLAKRAEAAQALVAAFDRAAWLTLVHLQGVAPPPSVITALATAPAGRLTSLTLRDCVEVADSTLLACPALFDLPALEAVDLSFTSITHVTLAALSQLPALRAVSVAGCREVAHPLSLPSPMHHAHVAGWREVDLYNCTSASRALTAGLLALVLQGATLLRLAATATHGIDLTAALAAAPDGPLPLRHVALDWCDDVDGATVVALCHRCPALEVLSCRCIDLTPAQVRSIATACPQLRDVDMDRCGGVDDEAAEVIVTHCTRLAALNVGWSMELSHHGLQLLLTRLPQLTALHLVGCKGLASPGLEEAVAAAAARRTGGIAATVTAACAPLRLLDLSWVNCVSPDVVSLLVAAFPHACIVDYYTEPHGAAHPSHAPSPPAT